ncbi:cytoplasmic protein [Klebsiella grimontii]|uniref:Cytoplasmic protein n=1 Tax=Klebsiella grimontii TaxID=2058152 RepID=A0A7H4P6A1_9ENTR|nr:cytoplasmic protein [Klebsiella grimontii]
MKQITGIYTAPSQHWVGDGFPVRSMFSYQTHGEQLSPSCCLTMQARITSRRERRNAASANIRIADLRPLPSSTPAKLNTVTLPVEAALLGRVMCSG